MTITAGRVFSLGNLVLTAFAGGSVGGAMLNAWHIAPDTVAAIAATDATLLFLWNGAAFIFTGQTAQAQSVAANIEDPNVKRLILPAVANLDGLEPLQATKQADQTVKDLANDPNVEKILPAKT